MTRTETLQNRAAPSAVLQTDLLLDQNQAQQLRDRWNEQSKGLHAGGVPILTHGLKVMPWTTPAPAKDLQLAELLQLTDQHIALAFRVPLQILGLGAAPLGGTQTLMSFWLASGLGFALNHIEQAFDKLFGLSGVPDDFCEFSTDALLRSDQKDRIEALVRGVQGGVFSPNEARNLEGLDSVEYGGEPRVQMQVVPLSAAANIPAPGPEAAAGVSHAAPEATKSYQAAVKSDLEALTARLKRPTRKPVIRKTKANGHAADFENKHDRFVSLAIAPHYARPRSWSISFKISCTASARSIASILRKKNSRSKHRHLVRRDREARNFKSRKAQIAGASFVGTCTTDGSDGDCD